MILASVVIFMAGLANTTNAQNAVVKKQAVRQTEKGTAIAMQKPAKPVNVRQVSAVKGTPVAPGEVATHTVSAKPQSAAKAAVQPSKAHITPPEQAANKAAATKK